MLGSIAVTSDIASANPEAELTDAFSIACLDGLDNLDSYEARLAAAGFIAQRDSGRVRGGQLYYVSEPQTFRNETCGGSGLDADPVAVGAAIAGQLTAEGYGIGSATRTGRRTAITFVAPEGTFDLSVEPAIAGTTRNALRRQ